jgi:hypothetical protein
MRRGLIILLVLGFGLLTRGVWSLAHWNMDALLSSILKGGSVLGSSAGCVMGCLALNRIVRRWKNSTTRKRGLRNTSSFADEWIPMLYGDYKPYVVEAAEKLGAARETTAVPALMHVLEQTVNTQPPDWCETAEALVVALGRMGDRRALPLLNRLSNVRGIGLLTVVHEAINRIEPETSLLRPGSADDLPREILLRPAESCPETDPATLLRAHNGRP